MYALIDANSYYASCEMIFRPELRGQSVIVLSNNDGFVIARSKKAKSLGIPDLEPFFKIEKWLLHHGVAVFSSNFPLYGDISERVMTTLRPFSPEIEVYSIDEMFLSFHGMSTDFKAYGQLIKQKVWRDVRIPVSVGIAPSKTLSKAANRAAKKIDRLEGVCLLDTAEKWNWLLKRMPVDDVWGVGKRLSARLKKLQVHSALDLATANAKMVRRHTSINMERTIEELNGHPCLALEEMPPAKKQIYCTRSFGSHLTELSPILEAVSLYAARAAVKLRKQRHLATVIHVFIHSSPHKPNYHSASRVATLPYPTDDTRIIAGLACEVVSRLFKDGHAYLKAGVGLVDVVDRQFYQGDLWHPGQPAKADRLMKVVDAINQREGLNSVFFAGQGVRKPWMMRQQYRSPEYTTKWSDIPVVKC